MTLKCAFLPVIIICELEKLLQRKLETLKGIHWKTLQRFHRYSNSILCQTQVNTSIEHAIPSVKTSRVKVMLYV